MTSFNNPTLQSWLFIFNILFFRTFNFSKKFKFNLTELNRAPFKLNYFCLKNNKYEPKDHITHSNESYIKVVEVILLYNTIFEIFEIISCDFILL